MSRRLNQDITAIVVFFLVVFFIITIWAVLGDSNGTLDPNAGKKDFEKAPDGSWVYRPKFTPEEDAEFLRRWNAQQADQIRQEVDAGILTPEQPFPPGVYSLPDVLNREANIKKQAVYEDINEKLKSVEESLESIKDSLRSLEGKRGPNAGNDH